MSHPKNRRRKPSGTRAGGEFAETPRGEADWTLDESAVWDRAVPDDANDGSVREWGDATDSQLREAFDNPVGYAVVGTDGVAVFKDRGVAAAAAEESDGLVTPVVSLGEVQPTLAERLAAEKLAGVDPDDPDDPDGPWSWTTFTEGTSERHADDMYDRYEGSLGRALAHVDEEWSAVGVSTKSAWKRCHDWNVHPSDFESEDRDIRMMACIARGDKTFDGQLTEHALSLKSNKVYDAGNRTIYPAGFGGKSFGSHSTAEQLAYTDGYSSCVNSHTSPFKRWEDRGPASGVVTDGATAVAREAGWARGRAVEAFRAETPVIEHSQKIAIVDSMSAQGRPVELINVTPHEDPSGHVYYTGDPTPGQRVETDEGETRPRLGIRVRFETDAFIGFR